MTALSFEWVTDVRGLRTLRDAWRALDDGAAPGAVFRSWEWQATWWRHLGQGRGRELAVLVARDASGPCAILPLYIEEAPLVPFWRRRRARFLADGVVGSDYLGLVARGPELAELAPLVAARVARDLVLRGVDLLLMTDILDGDPLAEALARSLPDAGWGEVARVPRHLCPRAVLAGVGRETWLARRPQGFGSQLRKRTRRLARERGYSLLVHDRPDDVVRGLDALFALHRARWAARGGSDAIPSERVERFHREAARALAERGFARLALLEIRGRPVAAGYGFARAGRFAYYQAGVDPAWMRLSAGTVLLGALLERAFDEGLEEFDFLHGEEPYKSIWADEARTTHALVAVAPSTRARVQGAAARVAHRLRAGMKDLLPAPALAAARRALRPLRPFP